MASRDPSWMTPPVHEPRAGRHQSKSSWQTPPVASDSVAHQPAWMTPSVCTDAECGPKRRRVEVATPKWIQPPVCREDSSAAGPAKQQQWSMAEIDLTVGMALLSCGSQLAIETVDIKNERPKVEMLCKKPCSMGKSKQGTCSVCEPGLDVQEALTFVKVWKCMTGEMKGHLLSTVYQTGNEDFAASRVKWRFLGKRTCVARLCAILSMTPRTCYKYVHGVTDGRSRNFGHVTPAGISVDQFFLELYHSAAEFLPESTQFHIDDVDSAIEETEGMTREEVAVLKRLAEEESDLLPLVGCDPEKTLVSNMAVPASCTSLPIRYIQHQHVVDVWWFYLSWMSCRAPDTNPASWSTFWRKWVSCLLAGLVSFGRWLESIAWLLIFFIALNLSLHS